MKMMRSTVFIQRTLCKYKNRGLFLRNYTKSTKSQQFDQIYTTFDGKPISLKTLMKSASQVERDHGDFAPSQIITNLLYEFGKLDFEAKRAFFLYMTEELGVNHKAIKDICADVEKIHSQNRDDKALFLIEKKLRQTLTAPYEKIFTQIIARNGGLNQLISIRADLLEVIRKTTSSDSNVISRLKNLDDILKGHLQSWFSIGFLNLERITWSHPGVILERIKSYSESVHPMATWNDLKNRLSSNKRCYAYFHPSMPTDPVVFIEVQLTDSISSSMEPIISDEGLMDIEAPSTAIFYAITSTQPGLSGIDLGNMLIKRVVSNLKRDIPSIMTFCTLSPIPKFKNWLDSSLALAISPKTHEVFPFELLTDKERDTLKALDPKEENPVVIFKKMLESDWSKDQVKSEFLKDVLLRLCTYYLYTAKKNNLAYDPVANFHLRNGAQLYRVNWMADTSDKRFKQSYGLMVNYLYKLEEVEENNQNYLVHSQIRISNWVKERLNLPSDKDPLSFLDQLDQCNISDVLHILVPLIQSSSTQLLTVEKLLSIVSLECDEQDAKHIIRAITDNIVPDSIFVPLFVNALQSSPHKLLIIEALPFVIPTESEEDLSDLIHCYKQLMNSDESLLLPIIGSLAEIKLPKKLKKVAFDISESCLSIVQESDIPSIVRTILLTITKDIAETAINSIRVETNKLTTHNFLMVIQVISNAIKINVLAIRYFLITIQKSKKLYRLDVYILLILMGSPREKEAKKAELILFDSIKSDTLDIHLLKTICQDENDDYIDPSSLLKLCELFINSNDISLIDYSYDIYLLIYLNHPTIRVEILNSLFAISSMSNYQFANLDLGKDSDLNSFDENLVEPVQWKRCLISLSIIATLSDTYPKITGDHILLFEDILFQWSHSFSLKANVDSLVHNKQKILFSHTLCRSIAVLSSYHPKVTNNLLIYIQKQMSSGLDIAQMMGLIMATHLIEYLDDMDVNILLNLVIRLCRKAANDTNVYLLDLAIRNIRSLSSSTIEKIHSDYANVAGDMLECRNTRSYLDDISVEHLPDPVYLSMTLLYHILYVFQLKSWDTQIFLKIVRSMTDISESQESQDFKSLDCVIKSMWALLTTSLLCTFLINTIIVSDFLTLKFDNTTLSALFYLCNERMISYKSQFEIVSQNPILQNSGVLEMKLKARLDIAFKSHPVLSFRSNIYLLQSLEESTSMDISIPLLQSCFQLISDTFVFEKPFQCEQLRKPVPSGSLKREVTLDRILFISSTCAIETIDILRREILNLTQRDLNFESKGNMLLDDLIKYNSVQKISSYSKVLSYRIKQLKLKISEALGSGRLEKAEEFKFTREKCMRALNYCYLILNQIFGYIKQSHTFYNVMIRKISRDIEHKVFMEDLYIDLEQQWSSCEDQFLAVSLMGLLYNLTHGAKKSKVTCDFMKLSLKRLYPSHLECLAEQIPNSFWNIFNSPASVSFTIPKTDKVVRFFLRGACHKLLIKNKCLFINELIEALNQFKDNIEDINEHPYWRMMYAGSISSFCINLYQIIYELLATFDSDSLGPSDDPFMVLHQLIKSFFNLSKVYLSFYFGYRDFLSMPDLSFLIKIITKLSKILKDKLNMCIEWRSTSKKASLGTLTKPFTNALELVNFMNSLVAQIKLPKNSKISDIIAAHTSELKNIPKCTLALEQTLDYIYLCQKRHHVELEEYSEPNNILMNVMFGGDYNDVQDEPILHKPVNVERQIKNTAKRLKSDETDALLEWEMQEDEDLYSQSDSYPEISDEDSLEDNWIEVDDPSAFYIEYL